MFSKERDRGLSFIETIIGIAIFVVIFLGLFAGVRVAIEVVTNSKAKTGALALLSDRIETIRAMPYDSIGTSGGIPTGSIEQSTTTLRNSVTYTVRTLIQYIDAPEDGVGVADENGITADSKQVKVEVSWTGKQGLRKTSAVTTIAPNGLETLAGGGTLRINVFDALGAPVQSASVRVENPSISPAVDVTTFTNTQGIVLFPGSPAGGSYKVTATKSGYSTSQTYDADISNPNPTPGHLTIVAGQTTTSSFAIDLLSTLIVRTFRDVQTSTFTDTFTNNSLIAQSAGVAVGGGDVDLLETGGVYNASGSVVSTTTTPSSLQRWVSAAWNDSLPAQTAITYQVVYESSPGVFTLVPDGVLTGNSTGFNVSPVSLTTVPIATYPSLALQANLTTGDTSVTPAILDWTVTYDYGPVVLPNIPFSVRGTKQTGTTASDDPIYKFSTAGNTGASGSQTFSNLEWDAYLVSIDPSVTGYDIAETCLLQPLSLQPNTSLTNDLVLTPQTTNSLLVAVKNAGGSLLANASVRLWRSGFDQTETSSACGQVFFSGLSAGSQGLGNPYTLEVTLGGYQIGTSTVDVGGPSTATITLEP